MRYKKVIFSMDGQPELMEAASDIVAALAGEIGFESFEQTEEGVVGYVQQDVFDEQALATILEDFPLPVKVSCEVQEAAYRNWNEQWEQEGFEPWVIQRRQREDGGMLVVHDGRHLPSMEEGSNGERTIAVEIDAHMAFGTGSHETTRMMLSALTDIRLQGCSVLDCGCGTGILAIAALKLGAERAVGYDIDEWSAENARHNAIINRVEERFSVAQGDASLLGKDIAGTFQVVMANINRNILLADMAAFCQRMDAGASLLLSGFYEQDIPLLMAKAEEMGLHRKAQQHDGDWAFLWLEK